MHVLILGGSAAARRQAAEAETAGAPVVTLDAGALPFLLPGALVPTSPTPRVVSIDRFEHAFPNNQARGTRLIVTQSTYLLQKLVDALAPGDRIVATAERTGMERNAPELFFGRGPWRFFELVELEGAEGQAGREGQERQVSLERQESAGEVVDGAIAQLAAAYRTESPEHRLRLCREAAGIAPTLAAAHLALASACRESQDTVSARAALDQAERLAPAWEAVAYESGKFWLAHEDMGRASMEFKRAADLMPTFSAAFGNLGATLGELGQPEAALAAFTRALVNDPDSFTVLNNIGVVNRELGRLDEAIAASYRVIELAPDFVFGHYNLGHALFLAGRFAESLAAYEEGQRRDPQNDRRQGCRLALARFANGDIDGAVSDLWRFADAAPADEREDLLIEAYEIADALMGAHPRLVAHKSFADRIAGALSTS